MEGIYRISDRGFGIADLKKVHAKAQREDAKDTKRDI
jgi:hypothetical protein